jgi:hypothetical protein
VKTAGDAATVVMARPEIRARSQKLLDLLDETEGAEVFAAPVPKDLYPEYYEIISEPMDLGTVRKRLEKDYVTVEDFAVDVRLTLHNCMSFNDSTSEISLLAGRLRAKFERLLVDWIIGESPPALDELSYGHCLACQKDAEADLLLCDTCDASYHSSCLDPPLKQIPTGDWFCPHCVEANEASISVRNLDGQTQALRFDRMCEPCHLIKRGFRYCRMQQGHLTHDWDRLSILNPGKVICEKCGKKFLTTATLKGHTTKGCIAGTWSCMWCKCTLQEANGRSPGPGGSGSLCSACGSRFRGGAKGPIKQDADGKFICDKGCGRLFDAMAGIASHRRNCTGGRWACDWCACKETETPGKSPGPKGSSTLCSACGSRFRGGHSKMIDTVDGKYECNKCKKLFETMLGLGSHRRTCDGGQWHCDWCKATSKSHAKSPGPNGACTLCSTCGSRYRNGAKGPPKRNEDGKYVCEMGCGRLFDSIAGVSSHRRTCEGSSWRCGWCSCKEHRTMKKSAGPDAVDQLCYLCSKRYLTGDSGPQMEVDGSVMCCTCNARLPTMLAYKTHRLLCDEVAARRREALKPNAVFDDLEQFSVAIAAAAAQADAGPRALARAAVALQLPELVQDEIIPAELMGDVLSIADLLHQFGAQLQVQALSIHDIIGVVQGGRTSSRLAKLSDQLHLKLITHIMQLSQLTPLPNGPAYFRYETYNYAHVGKMAMTERCLDALSWEAVLRHYVTHEIPQISATADIFNATQAMVEQGYESLSTEHRIRVLLFLCNECHGTEHPRKIFVTNVLQLDESERKSKEQDELFARQDTEWISSRDKAQKLADRESMRIRKEADKASEKARRETYKVKRAAKKEAQQSRKQAEKLKKEAAKASVKDKDDKQIPIPEESNKEHSPKKESASKIKSELARPASPRPESDKLRDNGLPPAFSGMEHVAQGTDLDVIKNSHLNVGMPMEVRLAVEALVQRIVDEDAADGRQQVKVWELETLPIRRETLGQDRLCNRYWWSPSEPNRLWLEPCLRDRSHWPANVIAFTQTEGTLAEKLDAAREANRAALVTLPIWVLNQMCVLLRIFWGAEGDPSDPSEIVDAILAKDTDGLLQLVALQQATIEVTRKRIRRAPMRDVLELYDSYAIKYDDEMSRTELAQMVDKDTHYLLEVDTLEQGEGSDEEDLKKEIEKEMKKKNKPARKRRKAMDPVKVTLQAIVDQIPRVDPRIESVEETAKRVTAGKDIRPLDPDPEDEDDMVEIKGATEAEIAEAQVQIESLQQSLSSYGEIEAKKEVEAKDQKNAKDDSDDSDDERMEVEMDPNTRYPPWSFLCTVEQLDHLINHLDPSAQKEHELLGNLKRVEGSLKHAMAVGRKLRVASTAAKKPQSKRQAQSTVQAVEDAVVLGYEAAAAPARPAYKIQYASGGTSTLSEEQLLAALVPDSPTDAVKKARAESGSGRGKRDGKRGFPADDPAHALCGLPRGASCAKIIREKLVAILDEYVCTETNKREYAGWRAALADDDDRVHLKAKALEMAGFMTNRCVPSPSASPESVFHRAPHTRAKRFSYLVDCG